MAQLLVAGCQTMSDQIRVHSRMPFIHFSLYALPRPRPLTNNSSQTALTWLLSSFNKPSLLALVAGAEQARLLISRDWILLWLFKIQTLLTSIAARVSGDMNEPFLQYANAERLMLKLIIAYKYAARHPISSLTIQSQLAALSNCCTSEIAFVGLSIISAPDMPANFSQLIPVRNLQHQW